MGIHWPTEYGGAGLTAEHNSAWQYECALAGVPAALNMVGASWPVERCCGSARTNRSVAI